MDEHSPSPLLIGRVMKPVAEFVPVEHPEQENCQPGRAPDPSPEEIARVTAAIRAGWSADEEAKRWQHPRALWSVPEWLAHG